MNDYVISQLLVSITLVIECLAMQQRIQNRILLMMSVSCFFNGLHFYFLDQPTACYIFLFASIRFLISMKWKSSKLAIVSLLVSLFITITSYIGFLSVLGFIGTVFITVGSFSQSDKSLRVLMTTGSAIWLVHNAILGTPVGTLLEAIFVISGVVGYYRYYVWPNRRLSCDNHAPGSVSPLFSGSGIDQAAVNTSQADLFENHESLTRTHINEAEFRVMPDTQRMFDRCQYVANCGDINAMLQLGLYFSSTEAEEDYVLSAYWLRRAARLGDDQAQFNLGVLYFYGWGLPVDRYLAEQLFHSAARQGNRRATVWCNRQPHRYHKL